MRAMPMLRITFRVRNANIIVSNGGTMQYHGITLVSAGWCDCARAASAQMPAKMTAEAAILVRFFIFTSSVHLGVLVFLIYIYPTIH